MTPKWFPDFDVNLPSMAGKRVAITGTTSGTGFIAAAACARKGAEVILLNRQSQRATDSEAKLRALVPEGVFVPMTCDCQDFSSVRSIKGLFDTQFGAGAGLDVLACNAGIMAHPDKITKDGFEIQMQTNHLSHFLLVKELLPTLQASNKEKGEARIVIMSSSARKGIALEAKYFQKSSEGSLGGDATPACFDRYHQSKLANAVFTFALEAKLNAAGLGSIKAVCCTPGLAATSLVDNLQGAGSSFGCCVDCVFGCISSAGMQSPEDGTMPLLHGIAKDVQSGDIWLPSGGPDGETYGLPRVSRRPNPKEKLCMDPAAMEMLWSESEKAILETFTISA